MLQAAAELGCDRLSGTLWYGQRSVHETAAGQLTLERTFQRLGEQPPVVAARLRCHYPNRRGLRFSIVRRTVFSPIRLLIGASQVPTGQLELDAAFVISGSQPATLRALLSDVSLRSVLLKQGLIRWELKEYAGRHAVGEDLLSFEAMLPAEDGQVWPKAEELALATVAALEQLPPDGTIRAEQSRQLRPLDRCPRCGSEVATGRAEREARAAVTAQLGRELRRPIQSSAWERPPADDWRANLLAWRAEVRARRALWQRGQELWAERRAQIEAPLCRDCTATEARAQAIQELEEPEPQPTSVVLQTAAASPPIAPDGRRPATVGLEPPQQAAPTSIEFNSPALVEAAPEVQPSARQAVELEAPSSSPDQTPGPHLLVLEGQLEGRAIGLERSPLVIGRSIACDIQLDPNDPSLGYQHARLEQEGGRWQITDLSGSGDTRVNGERLYRSRALVAGDRLQIGQTVLRFEAGTAIH